MGLPKTAPKGFNLPSASGDVISVEMYRGQKNLVLFFVREFL